jgi:hypothetical protein
VRSNIIIAAVLYCYADELTPVQVLLLMKVLLAAV